MILRFAERRRFEKLERLYVETEKENMKRFRKVYI